MTNRNREFAEDSKRKRAAWPLDFAVRKDSILPNIRVSAEERSCREGV